VVLFRIDEFAALIATILWDRLHICARVLAARLQRKDGGLRNGKILADASTTLAELGDEVNRSEAGMNDRTKILYGFVCELPHYADFTIDAASGIGSAYSVSDFLHLNFAQAEACALIHSYSLNKC